MPNGTIIISDNINADESKVAVKQMSSETKVKLNQMSNETQHTINKKSNETTVQVIKMPNETKNSTIFTLSLPKSNNGNDQVDAADDCSARYSVISLNGKKRSNVLLDVSKINGKIEEDNKDNLSKVDENKDDADEAGLNKDVHKAQCSLPWDQKHWNLLITNVSSMDCVWAQIILPESSVSILVKMC